MIDARISDVAVTGLAAAGCLVYLRYVYRQSRDESAPGPTLFLIAVLASLSLVRGFQWLTDAPRLLGPVFQLAALLPLAVTLFAERLLRRHHPVPLKWLAVAASGSLMMLNALAVPADNGGMLLALLTSLLVLLTVNGSLVLLRAGRDLTLPEARLARSVVVTVVLALPLLATDFREELTFVPYRLGGIAILLFVYTLVMLGATRHAVRLLLGRLAGLLLAAGTLALLIAATVLGALPPVRETLSALPLTFAWMLLTAIVFETAMLLSEANPQGFLRWLASARLDDGPTFIDALRRWPPLTDSVLLRDDALASHPLTSLLALARSRQTAFGIVEAQRWAAGADVQQLEAGESLLSLLQTHGRTHAIVLADAPPVLLLFNLAQGAGAASGRVRAGIVQALARRLAENR